MIVNAKEIAQLQNEVATNDGYALPWTQSQIDALGEGMTAKPGLSYAMVQNHSLSLSGGGSIQNFYTSFGYFNQEDNPNSGYDDSRLEPTSIRR